MAIIQKYQAETLNLKPIQVKEQIGTFYFFFISKKENAFIYQTTENEFDLFHCYLFCMVGLTKLAFKTYEIKRYTEVFDLGLGSVYDEKEIKGIVARHCREMDRIQRD